MEKSQYPAMANKLNNEEEVEPNVGSLGSLFEGNDQKAEQLSPEKTQPTN